ncbi:hypothetical protein V2J09_016348 [Rumex salicifolius]
MGSNHKLSIMAKDVTHMQRVVEPIGMIGAIAPGRIDLKIQEESNKSKFNEGEEMMGIAKYLKKTVSGSKLSTIEGRQQATSSVI